MYGSHYVWVLPGPSFLPGWVSDVDYTTVDCTYEEMIMASDWFIMLDYDRFDNRDIVTISGAVSSNFSCQINRFHFSIYCFLVT